MKQIGRRGFLGMTAGLFIPWKKLKKPAPAKTLSPQILFADLNEAYQNLSFGCDAPDLIICSPQVYAAITNKIAPEERDLYNLRFNGALIRPCMDMPKDVIILQNTERAADSRYSGFIRVSWSEL